MALQFDAAATSGFVPEETKLALMEYLSHPANPSRGTYPASISASRIVYQTRKIIADFFGVPKADHVIFTSGITESLNVVLKGLVKKGDSVVCSVYEHNSVLRVLYAIGAEILIWDGHIEHLVQLLEKNVSLMVCSHVSNVTGEIVDIHAAYGLCKQKGILFVVDTAQSAGIIDVSMEDMDILCFAGHKGLHGLQGIGGFCMKDRALFPSFKHGGTGTHSMELEQPQNWPEIYEAGTLNVPGILSLKTGIEYVKSHPILNHSALRQKLINALSDISGIHYLEDPSMEHIGILSLVIDGISGAWLSDQLAYRYQIQTRYGAHCAPMIHKKYGVEASLRLSFAHDVTEKQVEYLAECIHQLVKEKRT